MASGEAFVEAFVGGSRATEDAVLRTALKSYVARMGPIKANLESFDEYLETLIPMIVKENSDIVFAGVTAGAPDGTEHTVSFVNVTIHPPSSRSDTGFVTAVTPAEAIMRNLTYSSTVMTDVLHSVRNDAGELTGQTLYRELPLFEQPMMVGCCKCHTSVSTAKEVCLADTGGYFVVNGIEKVVLPQQKLKTNAVYVFPGKAPGSYYAEIRSCHEGKRRSTSTIKITTTAGKAGAAPAVSIAVPFIEISLPVAAVFKFMGVEDTQSIMEHIVGDIDREPKLVDMARDIVQDDVCAMTREELYDYVGKKGTRETTKPDRDRYINHILTNEVFPHAGLNNSPGVLKQKALLLGFAVKRLLYVHCGMSEPDDRDSFSNKRLECPGHLCALLFRQLFRTFLKSVSQTLRKKMTLSGSVNVMDAVTDRRITAAIKYAMSTGNWGAAKSGTCQQGVVQVLVRTSKMATLCTLRRDATPVNKDSKATKPRELHTSAYGCICPSETPEGQACGLVGALAILAHVRVGVPGITLRRLVSDLGLVTLLNDAPATLVGRGARVVVNGNILGFVGPDRAAGLVKALRDMRRQGALPNDVSVFTRPDCATAPSQASVFVTSDSGCLLRPLLDISRIGELGRLYASLPHPELQLWPELERHALVQYVDKDEEQEYVVATDMDEVRAYPGRYDYCEVHPSSLLGLGASCIPFADHNQSPRNTYQCAMGKQAIGVRVTNPGSRQDTVAYSLETPEAPLVHTVVEEALGTRDIPGGTHCTAAILSFLFNQEDSLIANQQAVQLGWMHCDVSRSYKEEQKASGGQNERFERPDPHTTRGLLSADYGKLGEDGLPPVGTVVAAGDVIIGKTTEHSDSSAGLAGDGDKVKRDNSMLLKTMTSETSIVEQVVITTRDGKQLRKVKLRTPRDPRVGDKATSRHGQKGVFGAVLPSVDLPFGAYTPDTLVNPHAIPSRMTLGHLMEQLATKVAASTGRCVDATAFRAVSFEDFADELERKRLARYGDERLFDGKTGLPLEERVFMGPIFYQRLKHQVQDKAHARRTGPHANLSRQPVEGRSRNGGQRFGEMERDCLIGHGAPEMLLDRMLHSSDPFLAPVCAKCGKLASPPRDASRSELLVQGESKNCLRCGTGQHVVDVQMPYAMKLFLQELEAMHLNTRMQLEGPEVDPELGVPGFTPAKPPVLSL